MKHLHEVTGLEFECGELKEIGSDKTFDMTVVTLWYEDARPPIIIGYYFGGYNRKDTDDCIDEYFGKRLHSIVWSDFLNDTLGLVEGFRIDNEDVMDGTSREKLDRVRYALKKTLMHDGIY